MTTELADICFLNIQFLIRRHTHTHTHSGAFTYDDVVGCSLRMRRIFPRDEGATEPEVSLPLLLCTEGIRISRNWGGGVVVALMGESEGPYCARRFWAASGYS